MTGILFDLDGTLLDTLQDLTDATNYALSRFGYPEKTAEQVRRAVGNGAVNQLRRCLPEGTPGAVVESVLAVYKPYYTENCQRKTRPYPGIPEVLAALREKYPLAIVSNKPDGAVKALCDVFFPGIFALGEMAGCPRKPAADMVHKGMEAIGVDRCVYVGDSEVDVLTAKNAGMPCLCVQWGFRDKEDMEAVGGRHFCADAGELAEKLEELIHGQ